jgi:hypothetical protein
MKGNMSATTVEETSTTTYGRMRKLIGNDVDEVSGAIIALLVGQGLHPEEAATQFNELHPPNCTSREAALSGARKVARGYKTLSLSIQDPDPYEWFLDHLI